MKVGIVLGKGSAKPEADSERDRNAFFLCGGPERGREVGREGVTPSRAPHHPRMNGQCLEVEISGEEVGYFIQGALTRAGVLPERDGKETGPPDPRFCLGRCWRVGLKQPATMSASLSPGWAEVCYTYSNSQIIPKTAFGETPPPPPKHHRARAVHACSLAGRARCDYSYRREKEGSEKLSNLTQVTEHEGAEIGIVETVGGKPEFSPLLSGFRIVFYRASACFEGPGSLLF